MLSCAELIVKVLDGAGQPLNDEGIEPEVREYAEAIKKRYGELKREHGFGTAAYMARVEIVGRILAADFTELFTGVVQSGRTPDSESGG